MNTCEGCAFQHRKATCKRCLTCSRNYADKHQGPPKPRELTREQSAAVVKVLAMAAVMTENSRYTGIGRKLASQASDMAVEQLDERRERK